MSGELVFAAGLFLQFVEASLDVATGNFAALEIRQGEQPDFFYFYDTGAGRLIKSFVLREGQRVDTMCDVVLIKKDDDLTPRLSFWRKDKTKGTVEDLTEEELIAEGRTILIKARVDTGDCHRNYWKFGLSVSAGSHGSVIS